MKDTITLEELRKTELYRKEQTRPLRELLKQEPVAWMDELGDLEKTNPHSKPWTPLYTAPRELSDEEIKSIKEALKGWKHLKKLRSDLHGYGWEEVQNNLESILKKASEK